jgi:trehalose synthase
VTSVVIEDFGAPGSTRDARVLEFARRRAADELAGRTVWCAGAARHGRSEAQALSVCLRSSGELGGAEHVDSASIEVEVQGPLMRLTERLDAMLRGIVSAASTLGPAEAEVYAGGVQDGEELVGRDVRPGDVVVLHDPLAAALAQALRARGAHVVWRVAIGRRQAGVVEAWRFLHRIRPALDAYVTAWRVPATRRRTGLAAFMSSPDVVSAKEIGDSSGRGDTYDELGWASLLADVVQADREERVGGTLRPRPTVAAR